MITLISAMGKNNEIGVNNQLLWDLPKDMKHFRTRTKNKTVVMGRKTFESIGMALPNRINIILTRDKNYDVSSFNNTKCVYSVQEILDLHAKEIEKNAEYEMMIIGGSNIYETFLEYATNLSITFVESNFTEADSFFPQINFKNFTEISCKEIEKDENNIFDMKICEFEKSQINKKNAEFLALVITVVILFFGSMFWNTYMQDEKCDVVHVSGESDAFGKPVIYLYPEKTQNVLVQLDLKGNLIADYPDYNEEIKGWNVQAFPDGRLIDKTPNNIEAEYSYIFWEGVSEKKVDWDLSKGFIVKGKNTKIFLQEKLKKLGLTPKEYNEFIVYWFPLMQDNEYNLIHFAQEQYTDYAPLTILPSPDSLLRVFMVYKPLNEKIEIEEQKLDTFKRAGFSVVEWGGTQAE